MAEPGHVARGDLKDLHALAEQYPWFAGAQLLRTIGEQRAGDVRSEETLHTAAIHVPSRSVLFDLVANSGKEPQALLTVVSKEEVVDDLVKDEPTAESLSIPSVAPLAPPKPLPPLSGPVQEVSETASPAVDPLEAQIMDAARASAYDLTWDTVLAEQPATVLSDGPTEGKMDTVQMDLPSIPEVAGSIQEETGAIAEKEREKEEPRPRGDLKLTRLLFTDWLEQDQVGSTAKDTSASAPPEQPIEGPGPVPPEVRAVARMAVVLPKEPAGTKDLIDRFIQQQNPAAPTKVAFFTPQQAGKRSLDDTTGLVTETLARIYAKQGNLPKAIDAYHRLAIKYPAKSAYFAALAKELEGQLNS